MLDEEIPYSDEIRKQVNWADKQTYSALWINILKQASFHRIMGDLGKYYSAIDCLVDSLFEKQRDEIDILVDGYRKEIAMGGREKLKVYRDIQRKCEDVLTKAGYFTKESLVQLGRLEDWTTE